ncbi:MAG: ATP-dependent helicase [Chitinispirillaceae bacterium]|nr:ATP-dependent helicase [Chitinispirillaceae bacterium]
MKNLVEGLNEEQCAAVRASLTGSILVLAGAGCGKTTVLTRRIGWLCSNGFDPEHVCALTFTRKAADEMRERVSGIELMKECERRPFIATFHSFALFILREKIDEVENFVRLGYSAAPTLQTEKERLKLISEIVAKGDREILGVDLIGLESLITRCTVFPEKINAFSGENQLIIRKVLHQFTYEKRRRGVWDFEDLTADVIELFKLDFSVLERYQKKFRYFLVDEFQDTNPVQIAFLRQLLLPSTGLFAVGDDDQAIYGFRGADVRPTLEFTTIFNNAGIVKLQTNYRSSLQILHAANSIFKKKPQAYRKILRSGLSNKSSKGVPPKWLHFENQTQMADFLIGEAQKQVGSLKINIHQCAVLFRINRSLEWVSQYYAQQGFTTEETPALVTIHGSKGLEYPVVFLCDLEESVFPNYRPPGKKVRKGRIVGKILDYFIGGKAPAVCDWDEEQRLFYVGVTRAKQVLYMITVRNKFVYGRKRKFERSRFRKLF